MCVCVCVCVCVTLVPVVFAIVRSGAGVHVFLHLTREGVCVPLYLLRPLFLHLQNTP